MVGLKNFGGKFPGTQEVGGEDGGQVGRRHLVEALLIDEEIVNFFEHKNYFCIAKSTHISNAKLNRDH